MSILSVQINKYITLHVVDNLSLIENPGDRNSGLAKTWLTCILESYSAGGREGVRECLRVESLNATEAWANEYS